jgi:hypothetical protein
MNNLECVESIRGSNLKLLAEHKTRIYKTEMGLSNPMPTCKLT